MPFSGLAASIELVSQNVTMNQGAEFLRPSVAYLLVQSWCHKIQP